MAEEEKKGNGSRELSESIEGSEEKVSAEEALVEETCEELSAKKDEEIRQLKDRVLRLAAETDNTRKRLEREKTEGICFANDSLIRDMLPVVDNLERAIQHGEKEADLQTLMDGVRMTMKAFYDVLGKYGCVSFESLGTLFDPNYHEAMMQQETSEYPEKTVIQEFQKGYKLNDRLIRPAMVVVSKAPSGESGEK